MDAKIKPSVLIFACLGYTICMPAALAPRVHLFDLTRGILILLMLVGHSVYFIHTGFNPLLTGLNGFADIVCFSGLLFVSGQVSYAAYVHLTHPTRVRIRKIVRRLAVYALSYFFLVYVLNLITSGNPNPLPVLTLSVLFPFTEFILPLIFLGLLQIPLAPLYKRIGASLPATLVVGIIVYLIGTWASHLSAPEPLMGLKAALVGHEGFFSFPLFQYFPIYLLGMYVSRYLIHHRNLGVIVGIFRYFAAGSLVILAGIASAYLLFGGNISQIIGRWPPTIGFLLSGVAFVAVLQFLLLKADSLKHLSAIRNTLMLFGQNAFALFVSHTFLLYLYQIAGFPQILSISWFGIVTIALIGLSLYLAALIPFNYQISLTLVTHLDDVILNPSPSNRAFVSRLLDRLVHSLVSIPQLLSITLGKRKVRFINPHSLLLATVSLALAALPIGIAENMIMYTQSLSQVVPQVERLWSFTSDETLSVDLMLPEGITHASITPRLRLNDTTLVPLFKMNDSHYQASLTLNTIDFGQHTLVPEFEFGSNRVSGQTAVFNLTEPAYVTWTIDWEGYDVSRDYISAMASLADSFNIPMTHLYNPYIFINPAITPERAQELTDFVLNRHAVKGEEIGLHLHMFPELVASAGVTPKEEPSWGGGFSPGYDILTSAYSTEEMVAIINWSLSTFAARNLPTPRTYRAGGWFADNKTLAALEETGFWADSSARTHYVFGTNKVTGPWNISPTTPPYYPSRINQNSAHPPPRHTILEIPNNGADDFAFSAAEMIERFTLNVPPATSLTQPVQVTYLSHPEWFKASRQQTMRQVFAHINQFSKSSDQGPVIFATLTQVYEAFK